MLVFERIKARCSKGLLWDIELLLYCLCSSCSFWIATPRSFPHANHWENFTGKIGLAPRGVHVSAFWQRKNLSTVSVSKDDCGERWISPCIEWLFWIVGYRKTASLIITRQEANSVKTSRSHFHQLGAANTPWAFFVYPQSTFKNHLPNREVLVEGYASLNWRFCGDCWKLAKTDRKSVV